MRIGRSVCIAIGLMLAAAAANADEVTVVSDVLGPEGPLFVDGNLYFVAWTSSTLSNDARDAWRSPSSAIVMPRLSRAPWRSRWSSGNVRE